MMSGDSPITVVLVLKDAGVPLADESAPILDGKIRRLGAHPERRRLISIRGSGQNVNAVVMPGRQSNRLTFGNDCIGRSGFGGRELELDAVISDCRGSISAGIALPLPSKPPPGGLGVVIAGCGEVVLEGNRLRMDGRQLCSGWTEAQGKGARLICGEGRDQRPAVKVRRLVLFL